MKLSSHKARWVRRLARQRDFPQRVIGKLFGVAQNTVSNVHTRTTWRHVH